MKPLWAEPKMSFLGGFIVGGGEGGGGGEGATPSVTDAPLRMGVTCTSRLALVVDASLARGSAWRRAISDMRLRDRERGDWSGVANISLKPEHQTTHNQKIGRYLD